VCTLNAQNINGWSQNEMNGWRAEISHRYARKEMSFWTPLWLEMKHGFCNTHLNPGNSHCNGAIRIPPEPKIQNINFSEKKSWRPIFGTEKGFCWSTSCLLAQKLMPLHIVTSWHGFDEPFKTKGGECCQAACACSTTRTAKFRARHHWASGKIQMGYIGPSAVNPGSRAQRFPLGFFFSTKETSCWEKLDDVDEVQEEGMTWFKGKAEDFCNSGMQKPVPRLNKCLDNPGDCVEK